MNSDSRSSVFLAHIVAQTQSNIDFLVSQNHLLASDVAAILSKLASLRSDADESLQHSNPVLSVAERTRQLSVRENGYDTETPERASSPPKAVIPTRRIVPPPPPSRVLQARAVWDYNENGVDSNDLSFRSGDIIEIVSETNPDWWTGRLNGRQGLFPSNYVEKLSLSSPADTASPARTPIPIPAPMEPRFGRHASPSPSPSFPQGSSYTYNPLPPPSWQSQPYGRYGNEKQQQVYAPPPMPPQVQPAPPPPEPEKKCKFGGLGNTMANSAAGGVGFGAGAAIGGGLINAIF